MKDTGKKFLKMRQVKKKLCMVRFLEGGGGGEGYIILKKFLVFSACCSRSSSLCELPFSILN